MSGPDYEALGFKAGLEIHQQLDGTKLFCSCPATIREDDPDFSVERVLRASVGESGDVDVAAAHAQEKRKVYEYHGYQDSTCLVELDEEPVSHPRSQAVGTAVMAAELFGMTRVDEVHPMRKVVVDGSNTSGFQRTMLVAMGGSVDDVRLDRVCLEEDSCKIVSRGSERDVYDLSRLGIPLLEITTKPDITDPQHLQETAARIGMVLRSTGRVKRGLGTIRQDVNVSIADGARVEIKGVQDLELMPLIAKNEVLRQQALIGIAKESVSFDPSNVGVVDVSDALESSKDWVQSALDGGSALAIRLPGLAGLLGRELYGGYRLGTELSGFAKAWGFGGLIHDAEDAAKYGVDSWSAVRKALSCSEEDGFVFLLGDAERAAPLLDHRLPQRLSQLLSGVPSEVRKAEEDGTTSYLRPMPGAARMYPETDVRTFTISDVSVDLPELISEKVARFEQNYGVAAGVAKQLIRSGRDELFEHWAGPVSTPLVAEVLASKEKELAKRHDVSLDVEGVAEELFYKLEQGLVSKSAVDDILVEYARTGGVDWEAYQPMDEEKVRGAVEQVVKSDPDAPFGALMGQAMAKLGGRADGETVSQVLREVLDDQ